MATYYVDPAGDNNNDGSSGSPWKTVQYAAGSDTNLQPGDTVIVQPGTYTSGAVEIKHSGSETGGYITFKSSTPGGAKIVSTGANGIKAISRSYIRIEGFDVSQASGGGIVIDRPATNFTNRSHHIQIINNISHDNGKMGIGVYRTDWVEIEGNTVYNNCQGNAVNSIVVLLMQKFGPDSATGYRMIIRGNTAYDNGLNAASTDSGGIMVDQDAQGGQIDWVVEPYNFPRLVENNLCYHNGGSGIIVLAGSRKRVDINPNYSVNMDILVRNNTCFGNARKPDAGGFVGNICCRCSDAKFVNNIAVADIAFNDGSPAVCVVSLSQTAAQRITFTGIEWHNNITWNYPTGIGSTTYSNNGNNVNLPVHNANGNKLGLNPQFVNVDNLNFRLAANSPAIDTGTTAFGVPTIDHDGANRTGTIDIGAYNYTAVTGTMSPNSTVAVVVHSRDVQTNFPAAVSLGGDFVTRVSRNSPAPAAYVADTNNEVQDTFTEVLKTVGPTLGSIVIIFSMEPDP